MWYTTIFIFLQGESEGEEKDSLYAHQMTKSLFVPDSLEQLLKNSSAMWKYAVRVKETFPKVLLMQGKSAGSSFNFSIMLGGLFVMSLSGHE